MQDILILGSYKHNPIENPSTSGVHSPLLRCRLAGERPGRLDEEAGDIYMYMDVHACMYVYIIIRSHFGSSGLSAVLISGPFPFHHQPSTTASTR